MPFSPSPEQLHTLLHEADAAARSLVRRMRLPRHDLEDIRQDLITDAFARLAAFDPARGSIGAFVATVMAHRFGLDVHFHSCGNILAIVGDLIDAGVDVVDPIQPDAVDLKKLAREFGGRAAFSGGISDQRLARQTPGQVKDEIRATMDLLGTAFGNAYLVAPSNALTPEIPLANIVAMFEACHGG